jgi:hypothetical protein
MLLGAAIGFVIGGLFGMVVTAVMFVGSDGK